jgi:general nucleoside transport system permease protein
LPDIDNRTPPTDAEYAAAQEAEKQYALDQERFRRIVSIATPFISVVIALLVGSVVILVSGHSPVEAYAAMFYGAFGGVRQIGETLLRATPLIFTGLAVAYGFRSGLFNIGAEGQLFLGGMAAAFVGVMIAGYPWAVSVPLILLSAMLAGAAWAFIPALMKAKIGAHEVITTMMFTYIGRYLVSWIVTGPFKAEGAIPQTPQLPVTSQLPRISDVFPFLSQNRAHLGFILGVAVAIIVWWILKYTVLGFEARAVGFNPFASQTGGVSVSATTIKSLCISGSIAGLAGATEVMGVHYRLFDQFSSGFGFTGIAVALLAKNNPIGVIAAAILFGALSAGAGTMQLEAGVSQKVISIIQGTIIFLVGAETIVTWTVSKFRRQKGGADAR